jgi:large subunit ribosomal protein L22
MAVTETPEVRAVAKWVRVSPRKARLVTDHIRGRSVPEARTILAFTSRAAAREIEKVLRSAVANAEANHGLIGDELYLATAVVDEGVTLKRWRPQARGRAHRIRKRTCHITIALRPVDGLPIAEEEPATPRRRRAEPDAEAPTVETASTVEESADEEQPEAKETTAEAQAADEKPKRGRRRRAEAEPEAEAEEAEAQKPEEGEES